jgi:hypothetical protein
MAVTPVKVTDHIRQELAKVNQAGSAGWLTDDQLRARVLQRVIGARQAFVFNQVDAGEWLWSAKLNGQCRHVYLHGMSFPAQGGADYIADSSGCVLLTAGADASSTLAVTAVQINFGELMVDMFTTIANAKAQEASQSVGGANFNAQAAYEQCLTMAEIWRGVNCA